MASNMLDDVLKGREVVIRQIQSQVDNLLPHLLDTASKRDIQDMETQLAGFTTKLAQATTHTAQQMTPQPPEQTPVSDALLNTALSSLVAPLARLAVKEEYNTKILPRVEEEYATRMQQRTDELVGRVKGRAQQMHGVADMLYGLILQLEQGREESPGENGNRENVGEHADIAKIHPMADARMQIQGYAQILRTAPTDVNRVATLTAQSI
ncbi:hypothetical protein DL93DRAFT_2070639 [Clavulina sp. PMI_390]|nr:hypothetical protein DL93DRAFT_2070639 [Clavulina sp. PMI_390]